MTGSRPVWSRVRSWEGEDSGLLAVKIGVQIAHVSVSVIGRLPTRSCLTWSCAGPCHGQAVQRAGAGDGRLAWAVGAAAGGRGADWGSRTAHAGGRAH